MHLSATSKCLFIGWGDFHRCINARKSFYDNYNFQVHLTQICGPFSQSRDGKRAFKNSHIRDSLLLFQKIVSIHFDVIPYQSATRNCWPFDINLEMKKKIFYLSLPNLQSYSISFHIFSNYIPTSFCTTCMKRRKYVLLHRGLLASFGALFLLQDEINPRKGT